MKTLIQDGNVVAFNGTEHEVVPEGVVVFEDDRIIFVGNQYSQPVDKTVDAKGCLVSPGFFIDTHLHSRSNAADYLLTEPDRPDFFAPNYFAHNAPLREGVPHWRLKDIDVGQRFCFIHVLKSGVTTAIELAGPQREPERFVEMVGEVGIRCYTGPGFSNAEFFHDREGRLEYDWSDERGSEGLKKAVAFARKFNGCCNDRVRTMLFPGLVDSCTPELLKETRNIAREIGARVQIHAAINLIEFHTIMRSHRCTSVELLDRIGFLNPEVSLAHCVFISSHSWTSYPYGNDLKILADSGTSVSHCPLKYLKMGITMESFDRYRKQGINVALGTDSYPEDIISEMRYLALACRVAEKSFIAGHPRDVYNAATLAGSKLLGREDLGRLEEGAKADIVIINLRSLAFGAIRDPIKALVEMGTSRDVRMVIVDGETLVDDGRNLRANEDELIDKVQAKAAEIWASVPKWHWTGKGVDEVLPPAFKMRQRQ